MHSISPAVFEQTVVGARVPTLLIASAGDKLLPSLSESSRLQRLMPQAQRVVLPDSGHTALLEVSSASLTIDLGTYGWLQLSITQELSVEL